MEDFLHIDEELIELSLADTPFNRVTASHHVLGLEHRVREIVPKDCLLFLRKRELTLEARFVIGPNIKGLHFSL